MTEYEKAAEYIGEMPKFTKKHTAEHTREFIRRLGDPCHDKKIIHVAGTNGKGSVCAYMQAILLSEGKRTGLFTSPHLIKLNERIRINDQCISDEEFADVFRQVKAVVEDMEKEGISHPSYFEFLYGMCMKAFEAHDLEYIILETGLGGRLDATNSFEHPYRTVITSVGMDHMDILGDSIEKIAAEKAGIIKKGIPVFYDGNNAEAADIIRQTAEKAGAPCREIKKDAFEIKEITDKHIAFSILNEYDKNTLWEVAGTGIYQPMNATIAVKVMEDVFRDSLSDERMKRWKHAVADVRWRGRMEEIQDGIILDGAHNIPAIRCFVESLRNQTKYFEKQGQSRPRNVVLFSAVSDKDYENMIGELCQCREIDEFVITKVDDNRGAGAGSLADVFYAHTDKPVFVSDTVGQALKKALSRKGEDGRLYCLGSLYLVGELMDILGGKNA